MKAQFALMMLLAGWMPSVQGQYGAWPHVASIFILTTPEGANLPEEASVEGFPLLVRLNGETFPFSEARPEGEDIRFSTAGQPLSFQIDEWNSSEGIAGIWVRVPRIRGNARQEIRLHWGNPNASRESDGLQVFNGSNGYISVLHLSKGAGSWTDEVGTVSPRPVGTISTEGRIGAARHLNPGEGIHCGETISQLPFGSGDSTTEAWIRPDALNAIAVAWGNEEPQGKVTMRLYSPPHVGMECYFSSADVRGTLPLLMGNWNHVVHTYRQGESRLYINGQLDAVSQRKDAPLRVKSPARMYIGGWYDDYRFRGDIDEVRISKVVRSPEWVKLEYENQKLHQTLVGAPVRFGEEFSVSTDQIQLEEGHSVEITAKAGGAQKVYWILKHAGAESIVATDVLNYRIAGRRVTSNSTFGLQFKAVYPNDVKIRDVAVTILDTLPEPQFTLRGPTEWNGRDPIAIVPEIQNLGELKARGVADLHYRWNVAGGAVIQEAMPDHLILRRSQYAGPLIVGVEIDNGGEPSRGSCKIEVKEPVEDPWLERIPDPDEIPEDGQFFARNNNNEGLFYLNGHLATPGESVFVKVYAEHELISTVRQPVNADGHYALKGALKPGLIHYRLEFGTGDRGGETVSKTITNLVCGDAYLIEGQSNALATDTDEKSPPVTSDWIRSYGSPSGDPVADAKNLWCHPVWKAEKGEKAELGYWGMELAKRLVAEHKIPIFILNAAVGGTRIDQHQRNASIPTDLDTIYGRMLWRLKKARLTHGIRAVFWHQGESDQGSDGPDGGYGWETYQRYFFAMSSAWKQDLPNLQHYYLFQIWPNSCSMGGGHGDRLREVQRTLPRYFSHMDIMSTLGIRPSGGCHYPLVGWAEFARLIQPLVERDNYGVAFNRSITAPNLLRASFKDAARASVTLEFDQPVVWKESLSSQFYLDGNAGQVESGRSEGNRLFLNLKAGSGATRITYLHEMNWSQDNLLLGANGIAALTFCDVRMTDP